MCVWWKEVWLYVCVRRCAVMTILTLSVWGWKEPGWWLTRTGRRTEPAGQPGCSWGPSWCHETGDAAGDGSGDGAAVAGGVGAGAEAGVWAAAAAAGSYRTAHCEKASVGRSGSDNQQGPLWTCGAVSAFSQCVFWDLRWFWCMCVRACIHLFRCVRLCLRVLACLMSSCLIYRGECDRLVCLSLQQVRYLRSSNWVWLLLSPSHSSVTQNTNLTDLTSKHLSAIRHKSTLCLDSCFLFLN